jgi:FkbM family methyltransferase
MNNLTRDLGYSGWQAYSLAVGAEDGRVVLHISNNASQSSSILELGNHKVDHPDVTYVGKVDVGMRSINSMVDAGEINLDGIDFLNIDIQGYELQALKGMDKHLAQFKAIYLEVNRKETYIGCPLVEDLDFFLAAHGFDRVETKWAGNTGWGDALWLRREKV